MRKALLALVAVVLLASFSADKSEKIILKDIEGTLLQSYVVIDDELNTITFETDANTTVSSSIINGTINVFLIENANSNESKLHTLKYSDVSNVSFDHYFETNFDVASEGEVLATQLVIKRPRRILDGTSKK